MTIFKKTADFDVARFMGERRGFGKCLDGLFRGLVVGYNNALPNEIVCGAFDWDGETVWTPCGYEPAFNAWSHIGRFLEHTKGDSSAQRKMFYAFQRNKASAQVIFGDNRTVFCADGTRGLAAKCIFSTQEGQRLNAQQLTVAQDGTVIFLTGQTLMMIAPAGNGTKDFVTHSIPLDSGVNRFKLLEDKNDSDFSYVIACETKPTGAHDQTSRLILIDMKNKGVFNRMSVPGVRDFSRHPQTSELVVVGNRLTVLSLPDLKTVRTVELAQQSQSDHTDPASTTISHSPDGSYVALCHGGANRIEIRDAQSLEVKTTLTGSGAALPDLSWDCTGRYLACRFIDQRDPKQAELMVWHIASQETAFRITTGNKTVDDCPNIGYRWSPHATALACLIDNQRMQIYELL